MNRRLMSAAFCAALLLNISDAYAVGACSGGARIQFDIADLLNSQQGPLELKVIKYSLQQMVTVAASKTAQQPIDIDLEQLGAKLYVNRDKNGVVTAQRAKSGSTGAKKMVLKETAKTIDNISSSELADELASAIKKAAQKSSQKDPVDIQSKDFSVCLRRGENLIVELTANGTTQLLTYTVPANALLKDATVKVSANPFAIAPNQLLQKGELFQGDIIQLIKTTKTGFITDLKAAIKNAMDKAKPKTKS